MFREIGLIWRIPVYDDTVTVNPRSLRLLLDLAGPEHVLLGLDWVWAAKSGGLMDAVGHIGLDQADQSKTVSAVRTRSIISGVN